MQLAADAVVFLTGLPIAGALVLDGIAAHHQAEVAAGVIVALVLGGPSVVLSIRARLRAHVGETGRVID
jgi:hypothetical protein